MFLILCFVLSIAVVMNKSFRLLSSFSNWRIHEEIFLIFALQLKKKRNRNENTKKKTRKKEKKKQKEEEEEEEERKEKKTTKPKTKSKRERKDEDEEEKEREKEGEEGPSRRCYIWFFKLKNWRINLFDSMFSHLHQIHHHSSFPRLAWWFHWQYMAGDSNAHHFFFVSPQFGYWATDPIMIWAMVCGENTNLRRGSIYLLF